jgi:hypothetical protein
LAGTGAARATERQVKRERKIDAKRVSVFIVAKRECVYFEE